MQVHRTLLRLGALAAAALVVGPAATASASIWTPTASGTTANITAVDYVNAGHREYGTASGQILENGAIHSTSAGFAINDIAFNPSGTIGLAAASNGLLLRSTNAGGSWATKSLANTTFPQADPCAGGTAYARTGAPTGNLNAVAWASDAVAYVVAADVGVVLKTTDGGGTWLDVSRRDDGTCAVDTGGDTLTDVKTVPGTNVVWLIDNAFGTRYISTDGLATPPVQQEDQSAVNCFDHRPQLALDTDNPNRAYVSDRCTGGLALGFTEDGGTTWDLSQHYVDGDGDGLSGLNDVAIAGGSALAVGNAGALLVAPDGRNSYFQPADGAGATDDWLSVSKLDANNATVGGRNGQLLMTDQASALPPPPPVDVPPASQPAPVVSPPFTPPVVVPISAPKPAPSKTVDKVATVPGASVTFGVPRACVAPGKTFTVTLTWKKQKKKGNRFVKVRRADFYVGTKRVKIDTSAPFRQTLKVTAGAKAGSTITVKARAYIKVTKGKSPTKSITSKIKVCG